MLNTESIYKIVQQLYLGSWESTVQEACAAVSPNDARSFAEVLSKSPGWRERVAAAKIIAAFGLWELAPALVHTFSANPENYTARAFTRLVSFLDSVNKEVLLRQLREACPATSYGSHLLRVIEEASGTNTLPNPSLQRIASGDSLNSIVGHQHHDQAR